MNEKLRGLAVIVLPANISVDEAKRIFEAALTKTDLEANLGSNQGMLTVMTAADIFGPQVALVDPTIVTLADNLVTTFSGVLTDQVAFATSFVCEYYGPRDLVNHKVVQKIASVQEHTPEWEYLSQKGLTFLVYQCRNILSNCR